MTLIHTTEADENGNRGVKCTECNYYKVLHWPLEQIRHSCSNVSPMNKCGEPGTKLAIILSIINFNKSEGCNCDEMILKMNAWGPEGCIQRREEIVSHLNKAYETLTKAEVSKGIGLAITHGLIFKINILDISGSLVDEAIRMSRSPLE
jgi:hypothetical protein